MATGTVDPTEELAAFLRTRRNRGSWYGRRPVRPRFGALVDPERTVLRLVHRIAIEERADLELAERILDQALALLAACGRFPGRRLAPSRPVATGWHTFILYTREYAEFCERVAGRFIHHVPQDAPAAPEHSKDPASVRDGVHVGSVSSVTEITNGRSSDLAVVLDTEAGRVFCR